MVGIIGPRTNTCESGQGGGAGPGARAHPVAVSIMVPAPAHFQATHGIFTVPDVWDGVEGEDGWEGGVFHRDDHDDGKILAPLNLREHVGGLHPLTIPAKFARIGGRQPELSVPPARAAALQRLPRACCARAHTALPHCFGECAVLPFKVQK